MHTKTEAIKIYKTNKLDINKRSEKNQFNNKLLSTLTYKSH